MEVVTKPLFVVSDAHLGADRGKPEQTKSARLLRFWNEVESQQGDLVILGDLFDFWFEYRNAIPRHHIDHLMALRRIVQSGSRVWYVAGNHDFWAGPFLEQQLGITFCADELELSCCGRRVLFAHGDGWPPPEHAYRMLKRLLRSRWAIALFRLLSPDLGFPLARFVSRSSHGKHRLDPHVVSTYADLVRRRLAGGPDLVVTAHLHAMVHRVWSEGEWIVTGDWIHHYSFARIHEDGAALLRWRDNGSHEIFEPETENSTRTALDDRA